MNVCRTVPYGTVPVRMVWHGTAQYRTVPHCMLPYGTVPFRPTPCHTVGHRAAPCRAVQSGTVPYRDVQYCAVPFRSVPYGTVPCRVVPCCAVPYHTVRYRTVPCHMLLKFQWKFNSAAVKKLYVYRQRFFTVSVHVDIHPVYYIFPFDWSMELSPWLNSWRLTAAWRYWSRTAFVPTSGRCSSSLAIPRTMWLVGMFCLLSVPPWPVADSRGEGSWATLPLLALAILCAASSFSRIKSFHCSYSFRVQRAQQDTKTQKVSARNDAYGSLCAFVIDANEADTLYSLFLPFSPYSTDHDYHRE